MPPVPTQNADRHQPTHTRNAIAIVTAQQQSMDGTHALLSRKRHLLSRGPIPLSAPPI